MIEKILKTINEQLGSASSAISLSKAFASVSLLYNEIAKSGNITAFEGDVSKVLHRIASKVQSSNNLMINFMNPQDIELINALNSVQKGYFDSFFLYSK